MESVSPHYAFIWADKVAEQMPERILCGWCEWNLLHAQRIAQSPLHRMATAMSRVALVFAPPNFRLVWVHLTHGLGWFVRYISLSCHPNRTIRIWLLCHIIRSQWFGHRTRWVCSMSFHVHLATHTYAVARPLRTKDNNNHLAISFDSWSVYLCVSLFSRSHIGRAERMTKKNYYVCTEEPQSIRGETKTKQPIPWLIRIMVRANKWTFGFGSVEAIACVQLNSGTSAIATQHIHQVVDKANR